MIVPMSRVLVLGPKRLLADVITAIQSLGSVHIDRIEAEEVPEVSSLRLSPEDAERQAALEALVSRADALLALLPRADRPMPDVAPYFDRTVEDLSAELARIEEPVRSLTRRRIELREEQELVDAYEAAVRTLGPLLGELQGSRFLDTVGLVLNTQDLTVVAGLRGELEHLTAGRVEVVHRPIDERRLGVVVAFHRREGDALRAFLARAGVTELRLPAKFADVPMAEAVATLTHRREVLPGERAEVERDLAALARQHRDTVRAIDAVARDRLARFRVLPNLAETRFTFVLHGWAPTRSLPELRGRLRQAFGSNVVVYDTPVDEHDHREAERTPVLLDNGRFIRPFQLMLGLFPPPRYGTVDPTPFLAVAFPLFVGLVIGDVAYGLLIFLFGWHLRNLAAQGKGFYVEFLGLGTDANGTGSVSMVVRAMAVWTIVFGALYGEFFGNLVEHYLHLRPLFNRIEAAQTLLAVVLVLGVVHVFLGLFTHALMAIRHRTWVELLEAVAIVTGIIGLAILLAAMGGMLPGGLIPWALILFVVMIVAIVAAYVMAPDIAKILWALEAFSGIGNILSYARLFALGLVAAVLPVVANQLGEILGDAIGVPVVGTVIAVLIGLMIQIVFFVLTLIGHMVQPARLNWVEFLSKLKYHQEPGRSYAPFQRTGGG